MCISKRFDPLLGVWANSYLLMALFYFAASLVVFLFLYREFSAQLKSRDNLLSHWHIHVVVSSTLSCLHACVVCWAGIKICVRCEDVFEDRLGITMPFAAVKCGFLAYDLWVTLEAFSWQHGLVPSPRCVMKFVAARPMVLYTHVVLPILCMCLAVHLRYEIGDFYIGCFFLTEAVIPFLSMRTICIQLELTETRMYLINGFLLPVAMVCFRFLPVPFLFWKVGKQFDISALAAISALPFEVSFGAVVLILLNIYRMTLPCPHTLGVTPLEKMYPDLLQPPEGKNSPLHVGHKQTLKNNRLKAGPKFGFNKRQVAH